MKRMIFGLIAVLTVFAGPAANADDVLRDAGEGGEFRWERDGDGNALIHTKDDLVRLRDWVAVGSNTVGMTFLQTADIDLGDMVWEGIGGRDQKDSLTERGIVTNAFCGTYDGQGHEIENVKLLAGDYDGFFNSVSNATIRNLKISIRENGVESEACDAKFRTDHTMAVFVGAAQLSTLSKLETVRGETDGARTFRCYKDAAGIVGLMAGGVVEDCVNNLDITFGTASNRKGAGIVILTQSGSDAATIRNCVNTGKIRCNGCALNGIGGILGLRLMDTVIEGCTNQGEIEVGMADGSVVGTIIGDVRRSDLVFPPTNKAQDTIPSSGQPVDGLNFATVEDGVATFVADGALQTGNVYKVMTPLSQMGFHFAALGAIAFDCALNESFRLVPTAEVGIDVVSSHDGAVWTYQAVPGVVVGVSNVVSRQRYPWNGLVDIDCEIYCSDPATNIKLYLSAKDNAANRSLSVRRVRLEGATAFTNALEVKAGKHRIVWDAGTDAPNVVSGDVTIDVQALVGTGNYLVIDLSGGPNAASYPVSYLGAEPLGGWTDEYKTDKLVLRMIQPGTFTMGSPAGEVGRNSYEDQHTVTLTKPFYMGVFEVTQRQWELVMGSNPSSYKGNARPVEYVSYNMIRGSSLGAKWPTSSEVEATSFIGKIRAKTGLEEFDLPTEAQWEYACRAGTTSALNSGKNLTSMSSDANMAEVGRYGNNRSDGKGGYSSGHTTVGTYKPNEWGLYDMHGNVWEWCLDWWTSSLAAATDPVGASSGSRRVSRGGSWYDGASDCRAACRHYYYSPSDFRSYLGFRLSGTLP